ncbi:(p)ppGpp synthetase I (GTP pyrophosphokinase), SpoT/RelA [Rhodospirillum rubrum F11]|uniref:GTP pyrophosphokinase rsh n=2 Tax=Rhodospirillum rubrum TaxID=1085 RepID=Q2RT89_RHORT|nr:(p)ppGpp synthetase I (GTP pyrophosphokinase), SpoT/RelA [Rhodospirillum rubrum ATCC 11170]AEO48374.1 (p)ppGpp synthetase I (GTP pyrophosphokinase), SpoT/RelA [Rhodospirillum rubrum F11]MBK5954253.1 bifunctional (p)ppGpp synthetase/guanosine-3',5'-bis(diphosphate) 3'-pyrophosphohydrolase [Rhodospirillum rubrum]HAQ01420.1 bifunctional (p)ppGpp synthetase/guanosine-3',5'-bis(diphosphate) 3'-pyrophosphohydrolase [Rhodospirillum rubrum]HCF18470.1 bifunctional (p)ppGpp synthetase/guanosine-3',5'-
MAMMRQFELVERVKAYDPNANEDLLNRAYVYAMKMHGSQLRASGDPYFSHPIDVAGILTRYKLDCASIITALLHDTIEDTEATLEDVRQLFGNDVARLVDGVTKLTRIQISSDHAKQAENFRKLLLAMSEDIRVLMVKLADRLHNMRTLHFIRKPEKRARIALETMEIYAPLAERIGMAEIKEELEDLAFRELYPDAKEGIEARLTFLREQGGTLVPKVIDQLKAALAEHGLTAEITGREKTPYSIWQKMKRKNISFEQLSDIMAFRITVENLEQCYQALGIIHASYPMIPDRFKDYISTPKRNGYQSIHTAVIGPERLRIEIQIRTAEMHSVAELGVAAHWSYKQGSPVMDGRQYRWIRELLEILEHTSSPEEFLEHTKLEMFSDQVFCFTPKGDLIGLPSGATPVDFAYAVHTQVGDRCVSAKVNGRLVPLRTPLHNGDQVEIATSKAQTPSPEWERFVVTGKARAQIRKFVRSQRRDQYLILGRQLLERAFKAENYEMTEKGLDGVLKKFRADSVEDLIVDVGEGQLPAREVVQAVYPGLKMVPKLAAVVTLGRTKKPRASDDHSFKIKGMIPGMALHFAKCCHSLPGDRIVGIVTTGKGITIHTIDCDQLEQFSDEPERWLDLAWDAEADSQVHVGRVNVVVANEPGSLGALTTVIAKNLGNITNLKITNRQQDFFDMIVDVEVKDVRHLTNIIAALRATSAINYVERARH